MVRRPILTLFAALIALLPMAQPSSAMGAAITLEGQVIVISGNQLPGPRTPPALQPGSGRTVVAVAGPLSPLTPGQAFLPARALKASIIARSRCNDQGRFRLALPASKQGSGTDSSPRLLTLLLVVPGGYYLNHFDGQGRFASLALPLGPDHPPIILRDDRGAIY